MGGTDKGTSFKGSAGKSKGLVSEATISKLLNDFSCASLLISSRPDQKETKRSAEEPHPSYEEVVSSLKHLHLRKPISARKKLKERKTLERKAKALATDKYNLSVAANNSQKPILWPGKLKDVSKNSSSPTFLQPCRLSVTNKKAEVSSAVCFNPSFLTSSSDEKSRIVNCLNKVDQSLFITTKDSSTAHSYKSFSDLCPGAMSSPTGCCHLSGEKKECCQLSTLPKGHDPCAKCHKLSVLKDDNEAYNLPMFSSYRRPKCTRSDVENASASSGAYSFFSETSNPECISEGSGTLPRDSLPCEHVLGRNQCVKAAPSSVSSISSGFTPAVNHLALERSCSEEVRMEESNVNELASYFEDLLHIPRKMSVMAEMMYA